MEWSLPSDGFTLHQKGPTSGTFVLCGLDPICIDVVYNADGSYTYENSWSITDSNGTVLVEGANNSATNCAEECGEGTVEAVLTMSDSFGDGWNGGSISVVVDGVVVVDMASASGSGSTLSACISDVCLPGGVLGGTSCVQITVEAWGCYDPMEMSWAITAFDGTVTLVAGDGYFGTGELGCDVAGCMDETACNYNPDATISADDCVYPELNADCEGNFVCDGVEFTLDMYDSYGDGWNGGTFGVVNWQTGEYEYGPVTLEDGASGTTQACFPQDMVWGCYVIQVGGGDWDDEIGWHLYGFEVFGSYVVDYSAGVSLEWESVGGNLLKVTLKLFGILTWMLCRM